MTLPKSELSEETDRVSRSMPEGSCTKFSELGLLYRAACTVIGCLLGILHSIRADCMSECEHGRAAAWEICLFPFPLTCMGPIFLTTHFRYIAGLYHYLLYSLWVRLGYGIKEVVPSPSIQQLWFGYHTSMGAVLFMH